MKSCALPPISRVLFAVGLMLCFLGFSASLFAQGCVAAHTEQPVISGLSPNDQQQPAHRGSGWEDKLHNLTLTVGFRTYSSYAHYVGTVYQVQRAVMHNQVQNHVDLYDISF